MLSASNWRVYLPVKQPILLPTITSGSPKRIWTSSPPWDEMIAEIAAGAKCAIRIEGGRILFTKK